MKYWIYLNRMQVSKEKVLNHLKNNVLFKNIPDNFIQWMIERSQVLQFEKDQLIYEQDAPAEKMYLLVNGAAALYDEEEGQEYLINAQQAGDVFGIEVLTDQASRLTYCRAMKRCMVLAVPQKVLLRIAEEYPAFRIQVELALQSLNFLLKKPMNWLQDDEVVHYINREHPLILAFRVLKPLLVALALLVLTFVLFNAEVMTAQTALWSGSIIGLFCLGWGIWNAFDWMNDFYVVTNQRVVFLEKIALIYDSRKETPLNAILSIAKHTSFSGRMYHFGDVVMRTFTGLIKFKNVANVEDVIAIVEAQWLNMKNKAIEEEDPQEVLRKKLLDDSAPENMAQQKNMNSTDGENLSQEYHADLFSRLLHLRKVEGDTIIYRTHWFVFIQKTLLPFLGLFLCGVFMLAPQQGWFGLVAEGTGTYRAIVIGIAIVMVIWWLYSAADWRNDYFMITPEQVVDVYRKPVGMEERRAAPIRNIQTIEYKRQNMFGLLFNFGTVFIRIGDVEFTFDYVPNPSYVQQEIFSRFQSIKNREQKESASLNNERLANWMEAYHKVYQEDEPSDDEEQETSD